MFKCPRKKRRYLWNVRVEKLKIYLIGDYLRQLILEDLTSSITPNKSKEEIAEERCKKIQKYLNSKAGLLKTSSKSINQELKLNYCRKNYCTPINCCDIHVNFIYHIRNGIKKKKRGNLDSHIKCKDDDKFCDNSEEHFIVQVVDKTLKIPDFTDYDKKIINRNAALYNSEVKSGTNVADDYFRQVYELLKYQRNKEKKIFNEKSNRHKVTAGFCQDEKKDREKFKDENRVNPTLN
ncbi:hypothetical protein KQX54_005817 [Cotesia glomerata]|uniref:Uncharacterized protein n=1 Tax=Cotesia glomerata TaxID=32391 RepID=A0AAV7IJA1_COTGL|nr:hypothetical protein KQX54_005817 [Cotesia glomerata]